MAAQEALLKQQNDSVKNEYLASLNRIKQITAELQGSTTPLKQYLSLIATKIGYFCDLESKLDKDYFQQKSLAELQASNREFFAEIKSQNYETSYANPEYCVQVFGAEYGALLASYYSANRQYLHYAFKHNLSAILNWNLLFIEVYEMMKTGMPSYEECKKIMMREYRERRKNDLIINYYSTYDPQTDIYRSIVMTADLSDLRYLYQYGKNISKNEIETAKFLLDYPQEKIDKLAETIAHAFIRGYELAEKDIASKKTVGVGYNVGQERIVRALVRNLADRGLITILNNSITTNPNKQYGYDHRFISALYLDQELAEKDKLINLEAAEEYAEYLKQFAGYIWFDAFGQKPFAPKAKAACLKFSKEQQQISQWQRMNNSQLMEKYMSRSKTSFCIVGFPLPEIGKDFVEIFEETCAINMIDTIHHEAIQQHLVDTLDKADYVHVKGKNGNLTDIKVKMHKLTDPAKQTNFVNCGADVNIPVGELFTSPVLTGTNGTLHLKETFLKQLKFVDLNLKFQDGYVEEYSCANFETEEENKKYIEENLLFPHKTLPIGEFAIGTNTLAYKMAQKFDILPLLPVLIVEKMGPHFAIGDTCFSWEEDMPSYNPIDHKEIIARDNERSILRKENPAKAYTNCHTDITLPYEDLDFITAVSENGEKFDIIRDGHFAVPGTEELNIPLDK